MDIDKTKKDASTAPPPPSRPKPRNIPIEISTFTLLQKNENENEDERRSSTICKLNDPDSIESRSSLKERCAVKSYESKSISRSTQNKCQPQSRYFDWPLMSKKSPWSIRIILESLASFAWLAIGACNISPSLSRYVLNQTHQHPRHNALRRQYIHNRVISDSEM